MGSKTARAACREIQRWTREVVRIHALKARVWN